MATSGYSILKLVTNSISFLEQVLIWIYFLKKFVL